MGSIRRNTGEYFYVNKEDNSISLYNPDLTDTVWLDEKFDGPFYLLQDAIIYIGQKD